MVSLLSMIGTQTVPGSPQFGFRSLRGLPRFYRGRDNKSTRAPSKIQSLRGRSFTTALSKKSQSLSLRGASPQHPPNLNPLSLRGASQQHPPNLNVPHSDSLTPLISTLSYPIHRLIIL
ncbi:hypothetical protein TNCV_3483151 [Trichonephila clavipes]|nr:hypothetical protein TNCV_3483151 [Trichonephila clavipes]